MTVAYIIVAFILAYGLGKADGFREGIEEGKRQSVIDEFERNNRIGS